MIITIFSEDESAKRSILAINLATLCARNHRKVLLADATASKHTVEWSKRRNVYDAQPKAAVRDIKSLGPELENPHSYFRTHYQDIIIDADGVNAWNADAAMVATDVLVIPIRFYQGDLKAPRSLAQRIESLRFYNPALRILIVDILTLSACSDAEQLAFDVIRTFAKKIPGAMVSEVEVQERLDDQRNFDQGLSLFDVNLPNKRAVAAIKDLHQEILSAKDISLKTADVQHAIMHAIARWTHEKADAVR